MNFVEKMMDENQLKETINQIENLIQQLFKNLRNLNLIEPFNRIENLWKKFSNSMHIISSSIIHQTVKTSELNKNSNYIEANILKHQMEEALWWVNNLITIIKFNNSKVDQVKFN